MKRFTLGLAAAAMVAAPSAAHATDYTICKNSVFVCVTARFELTGANGMYVYLFNGSTAASAAKQSVLTEFGFKGLGGTNWDFVSAYFNDKGGANTGTWTGWTDDTSIPSLGLGTIQIGANGPSGNGGVQTQDGGGSGYMTRLADGSPAFGTANSDWARFYFTYSGSTLANLNGLQWGFKVQAVEGFNGNSVECATTGEKLCSDTPTDDGSGGSQEVVPEPATMTLLATGLAGMAAASRRRRKQS